MSCDCDTPVHPLPLVIPAGLSDLPRQIARFPQFRTAMLADLRHHPELDAWHARSAGDLGVMLLEMWAVVCDAVSFYDQVHAQEGFLRTAKREDSVRGLIEVLGYVPRPAVAAEVELAVVLDGNRTVTLPIGTAFRSGAFDDQPPQVFELVADTILHPWNDAWTLQSPRPLLAGSPGGPGTAPTALHLIPATATARPGDVVLVVPSPLVTVHNRARTLSTVENVVAPDGEDLVMVGFSSALALFVLTPLAGIRLWRATRRTPLWTMPYESGSVNPIDAGLTQLVLDGLHRTIRGGERLIVERSGELRWFSVLAVSEVQQKVKVGVDGTGATSYAWLPATRITLDTGLNSASRDETGAVWSTADAGVLTVHHGLQPAGVPTAPRATTLNDEDPLVVVDVVRPTALPPSRFALVDADDTAVLVSGALDDDGTLTRDGGDPGWAEPLTAPVALYGNVVTAIRGQTVGREVLGSGDTSVKNQRFTLKKSPLTYRSADTTSGVASSLVVWVDGVRWTEVPSFFGTGPTDPIYVVRLDPAGVATLTFGDGVNGARVPTGAGNLVASYRFGAGAAVPPAGSIHQIAKPVTGLVSVSQPVAATGGADAEDPENVRTYGPRSALVLGRAVSILDLNALATAVPGVRAVQTTWAWHGVQQRPVVQCWFAGAPTEGAVQDRLRATSDPTTPIAADPALPLLSLLALDVTVDERYVRADVLDAVFAALADTDVGFLRVEQLGIGQPLYRSRLTAALLAVPGTVAVHFSGMAWLDRLGALKWWFQDGYGADPGIGAYFDFEAGAVVLDGEVRRLG